LIHAALAALVELKGFDHVSVLDIARQSGINRATFYEYFRNKYDLVEEILKDAINQLATDMAAPRVMQDKNDAAKGLADKGTLAAWERFFEHFAANASIYTAMIGGRGSAWFQARMRRHLAGFAKARLVIRTREKRLSNVPVDVIGWLFASSLVGVLQSWLDDRKSYSPSQVAAWFLRVVYVGYLSAAIDE
jgi:AcrR family transcriptional regulator